jgi:hypothetical protein
VVRRLLALRLEVEGRVVGLQLGEQAAGVGRLVVADLAAGDAAAGADRREVAAFVGFGRGLGRRRQRLVVDLASQRLRLRAPARLEVAVRLRSAVRGEPPQHDVGEVLRRPAGVTWRRSSPRSSPNPAPARVRGNGRAARDSCRFLMPF